MQGRYHIYIIWSNEIAQCKRASFSTSYNTLTVYVSIAMTCRNIKQSSISFIVHKGTYINVQISCCNRYNEGAQTCHLIIYHMAVNAFWELFIAYNVLKSWICENHIVMRTAGWRIIWNKIVSVVDATFAAAKIPACTSQNFFLGFLFATAKVASMTAMI